MTVGPKSPPADLSRKVVGLVPDPAVLQRLRDGHILEANEAFAALLDEERTEVVGRTMADLGLDLEPAERDTWIDALQEHGVVRDVPIHVRRGDERRLHLVSSRLVDRQGEPCVLSVAKDLTHRERLEQRLEHMAHRDPLTGLANRRLLREQGETELARAEGTGERIGLVFVDLARFKRINDSLGHDAGDEVLVMAAKRLKGALRTGDLVARVGGDEFVALVPEVVAVEELRQVAERFEAAFEDPFRVDGRSVELGLRMGLALYPDHSSDFTELLSRADQAMYEAELTGGDGVAVYSPMIGTESEGGSAREQALQRALRADELVVHYQPIYRAGDDALVGAEALARWEHPGAGLLSAADFLPLAERTGLIREIDEWVLRAVVDQLGAWTSEETAPRWVAVNLSVSSLGRADLTEMVWDLLEAKEIPPERLIIEVTERVALRDPEKTAETLSRLRARGVRVGLDEFGTGHALPTYLRQFAANILKLDMELIQQIGDFPHDDDFVAGIAALGRHLDMMVLAEGVESRRQLDRLQEAGVELAQGYHLGRARPAEEIDAR